MPLRVVAFDVRKRKARLQRQLPDEALCVPCQTSKPGLGPAADLLLLRRQDK